MFYFGIILNVVSIELTASYALIVYVPGIVFFGLDQNVSHLNSLVVLHDNSCILFPSISDISIIMDVFLAAEIDILSKSPAKISSLTLMVIPSSTSDNTLNSTLSKLEPLLTVIFHNPISAFVGIFNLSSENIPSLFDAISKDLT